MSCSRHMDRGFSLIEALVASMVMLIGLLGLAGLQVVGMRANNLGKRMAQASLLASRDRSSACIERCCERNVAVTMPITISATAAPTVTSMSVKPRGGRGVTG